MQRYAVVVDGYHLRDGDNRGFASAFRERGVLPVTIMSTPAPLPKFVKKSTWYPEDFAAVHFYDGDFATLLDIVRGYDPVCIVAGNERGVELTADLVEALMPDTGNVPGTAKSQRDKGEMALALERAGVPGPKTICTDDPDEVAAWIESSGLAGASLIVKPAASAGTDNVHLIGPGEDWRPRFAGVLGLVNGFDLRNDTVIVQEFLEGPEYIIDLYSVDGQHGVVDTCVYAKHDRGSRIGIYDVADFLPPDHPDVRMLAEYAKRAATAVGIRNGSTHAEVIVTADGPKLVELAARYSGSCMMLSGSLATGDNQIERTVRHHLDGVFAPSFEAVMEVRTAWLCADHAGAVREMEILEKIADLPTVHKMSIPPNGRVVPMTNDVTTSLGWIIQGADDWADIERDYRTIRELESVWNKAQVEENEPAVDVVERGPIMAAARRPPRDLPEVARIPHLLLVCPRSDVLGKLLGMPVALTVVHRPGGDRAVEEALALRVVDADFTDPTALLAVAREVHAWRPLDAVLGLTELSLYPVGVVGEALGIRANSVPTVSYTQNKARMRAQLAECGVDATAHRLCATIEEAREFAEGRPTGTIFKPVDGNGGTGIYLVRGPEDVEVGWEWTTTSSADWAWADRNAPPAQVLAEECLVGRELSVETMSAAGRHQVLATTTKHTTGPPHFVEIGHDMPSPLTAAEYAVLTGTTLDALDAIGLTWGSCHTELMLHEGGERATVVEMNPRQGGAQFWEMIELTTGFDQMRCMVSTLAYGSAPLPGAVNGGAAVRFLRPKPGRIVAFEGLADALAVDGVLRVSELSSVGDVVAPLGDSWQRCGYVIATGPDTATAVAAADEALSHILVRTVADD